MPTPRELQIERLNQAPCIECGDPDSAFGNHDCNAWLDNRFAGLGADSLIRGDTSISLGDLDLPTVEGGVPAAMIPDAALYSRTEARLRDPRRRPTLTDLKRLS